MKTDPLRRARRASVIFPDPYPPMERVSRLREVRAQACANFPWVHNHAMSTRGSTESTDRCPCFFWLPPHAIGLGAPLGPVSFTTRPHRGAKTIKTLMARSNWDRSAGGSSRRPPSRGSTFVHVSVHFVNRRRRSLRARPLLNRRHARIWEIVLLPSGLPSSRPYLGDRAADEGTTG